MMKAIVFLLIVVLECSYNFDGGVSVTVTYDHKALIIDGKRRVLQSGSIHYPRATPDVWPKIINKAKEGGLDVIETYVFWNYHEPVRGKYYFEGRFDLVKFVKTVQEAGLFVHLRIGPYACAEWNYGGFPVWLHFIPGIQFRTTNELFKNEMKLFLAKIVNLMKEEKLFASQGGPIILAQVENEYGNVQGAYGIGGELYVQWAAETAVSLNTSVPWVMCQQTDAPDPVINTCNGFYCDGFTPNSQSKPSMWTENYSGWFLSFGYPIPYRPVEDLAFAVARFFEKGGTFQNYYMYFGGTNFGRTAGGPLIATSYDYDAPLDEYGFIRQPKWGHLRDLHAAIKHCEDYLVEADPSRKQLGLNLEAHVYYKSSNDCAAFLANYDEKVDANVTFNGISYFLPAWSVSILPDCKNVIFNTAKVISQKAPLHVSLSHNEHSLASSSPSSSSWSWYRERIGATGDNTFMASSLLLPQTTFLAPDGKGPVSLNLSTMGKGQAWVNGQSIGRYWPAYLSPSTGCTDHCDYRGTYDSFKCLKNCGQPAQTLYHVPRTWLHDGENLLVLHEELGGDPSRISVLTQTGQEICGMVSQSDPPPVDTWKPQLGFGSIAPQVRLACDEGWHIASVKFASFGTPEGNCHRNVSSFVQQVCVGRQRCSVPVSADNLGDPCPGMLKTLAVQVLCSD